MKRAVSKNKSTIYRCYSKNQHNTPNVIVGNSLFDLIGKKEPDQTKSFGYVLATSWLSMKYFLELIFSKIPASEKPTKNISNLMKEDYTVDCELILKNKRGSDDRADIVLFFPVSQYAIIVEAKSITIQASANAAFSQGQSYAQRLPIKKKTVISLTNHYSIGNYVQWSDIVNMFDEIVHKYKSTSLEKEFLNYLLKSKGIMKYYDIEVLSIPAARTMSAVTHTGIYECPSNEPYYKRRGEHKPLYIAFRGRSGSVKVLYKVEELIAMPIAGNVYDALKSTINLSIIQRIEYYKKLINYTPTDTQPKWVFVLDMNNSITLPYEIQYKNNNTFVETKRPLSAYFSTPNHITAKGERIVLFT